MSSAAAPASAPRCTNLYHRRLAASPRSCLVCLRPSPHFLVSSTLPTSDFFAICPSHLQDRHFATLVDAVSPSSAPATVPGRMPEKVSKDEIEKVKREWEEREKAKKDKKAEGKEDDKEKGKEKGKGWISSTISTIASSVASASSSPEPAASTPAVPPLTTAPSGTHEKYTLHRDFYAIRLEEHKKRLAVAKAKELNLPAVPRSMPALPSAPR